MSKQVFKSFLYVFFLIILFAEVGCQTSKQTSERLSNSNWTSFRLRYNAIYNVDQLLNKAEGGMLREEIIWFSRSLFGEPDMKYQQDLGATISKMQEILPQTVDSDFKNSLYYKIGKAYYFKADYYTALEYFELSARNNFNPEILLWKARALTRIGREKDALYLIDDLNADSISKNIRSNYHAQKAEIFLRLDHLDSTSFYLEKALSGHPPKRYKPYWYLKLGRQLSASNASIAITHLQKVARSNTAPSSLKLQAELELIRLKNSDLNNQVKAFANLQNKGYSIGEEWQIHDALGHLYNKYSKTDSAGYYFEKILNQERVPSICQSKTNWEIAKLHIKEKIYDLAEIKITAIEPNHLQFFDFKDQKLIVNSAEWLDLLRQKDSLENVENQNRSEIVFYELARFYMNLGLRDEAIALVEKLQTVNSNIDYLHLPVLLDTSKTELLNTKYSELISQRQRFYTMYSDLYNYYQLDSFHNVIVGVESIIDKAELLSQDKSRLAYLKAFAVGHSSPVDSLKKSFSEILKTYNQDQEIVRKVKSHLSFIKENSSAFANRAIALEKPKSLAIDLYLAEEKEITPQFIFNASVQKNGTFIENQLPELEPYYFIVLIDDLKINLAPTRYGIGQFIRTRFPHQGYGHTLFEMENAHQLIKVGVFENLQTAQDFERKIVNLLPQIIKIGEKKYSTFVIPKSILDISEGISFINDYLKKYIEN